MARHYPPKGSKYRALFKHATAATWRDLPKKHMPILFHNWGELGVWRKKRRRRKGLW